MATPLNAGRKDFLQRRETSDDPDERRKAAVDPKALAATARRMSKARKTLSGGVKPITVQHVAGLPIGSRETTKVDGRNGTYKCYACMCVKCRAARKHGYIGSRKAPAAAARKKPKR